VTPEDSAAWDETGPQDPFPVPVPEGVRLVGVQWVDVHGATKAKLVPRPAYDEMISEGGGAGFAGFANDGFARGPEHPEMLAIPDPSTLVQLPHRPGMAVVMSTVIDGDQISTCDSRSILARVQSEAAGKGFAPVVGMEPEFFLLRRTEDGTLRPYDELDVLGKPCYDYKSLLRAAPLLGEIVDAMSALNWGVSAIDHEDGSGQYEINFGHASALRTADRFTLLRTMISDIAHAKGAIASFMPKPLAGSTGSGAHAHVSAVDASGANAFADPDDPRGLGLSQDGYAFIAGILDHAPGLAALTMPPE
jgi:glutamine synthetase